MFTTRRHRRRRTRHGHLVLFAGFALILSMLGGSLASLPDASAQAGQESSPAFLGEEVIEAPTPTPEPTAPLEAPIEPTLEPTETLLDTTESIGIEDGDPTDAIPNTVMAVKLVCPAGTDPTASRAVLYETCGMNPLGGVTFTLADADGTTSETTTPTGNATFSGVVYPDGGGATLSETIPAGYGDPVVYCGEGDVPDYALASNVSGTVTLQPTVFDGGFITCVFLNFPVEGDDAGDTGTVRVAKYTCPEGTERSEDDYALSEACNVEVAPVSFTVSDGGLTPDRTLAATAGVPQTVEFTDIPIGAIAISETVPTGYGEPLVFCSDTPADGAGNYEPVPVVFGSAAEWELTADTTLTCLFFNFPADDGGEGGDVHLSKYTCPAGTERSDDFYALSETCLEEIDSVQFTVTATSGGYEETLTADPGAPQQALFADVPFGEIAIEESVPDGYEWPLVFCADTQADGPGAYFPVEPWPESGAFILDHRAEAEIDLRCLVFNFHDDGGEGGDVTLAKYFCPVEVDPAANWPVLADQCTDSGPAVEFTVNVPASGYYESATTSGDAPPLATFADVPYGTLFIEETLPAGYVWPRVFCTDTVSDGMGDFEELIAGAESEAGAFTWEHDAEASSSLRCIVFNFLDEDSGNTVTVNKYVCPPGVNPETDILLDVCAPGGDGIGFEFVDGNGIHPAAVAGGTVEWTGVVIGAEGELQIIEEIPAGFGDPIVVCDGIRMESTNGFVIPQPGEARPFHVTCNWFNLALEDSSLTVIKHTCPPGYDPEAAGADPLTDCPTLTDGVYFRLWAPGPDQDATTGEDGTGMARFDALDPGEYALVETLPEGTAASFVSACFGNAVGSVRPFPLATGDTLDLTIYAGEEITCHWFNVPDRDDTSLTVQKFSCATKTFVSTVDCEVFEDGQAFDLMVWDGDSWEYVDTLTTDGYGVATFGPIDPGQYWVVEPDREWCHIESLGLSDDGNWLEVRADEPTVVFVYNCDGTPGKPGKTPTKYPNTGVPPVEGEGSVPSTSPDAPASLPFPALAGLLGLAVSRRRLVALAVPAGAAVVVGTTLAQDQVIEPIEGTPADATPASLCLSGEGDECLRGPVPVTLQVAAIGVDAPVEILETVQGVMQQPTDEAHVAWYKETARLGETGNLLLAGHVNWWGIPEAVFFNLGTLQENDPVILLAEDGTAYDYAVEWVRQESNLEPPSEEVLGMTNYEAVTLMTCSGEWNSEISEYDSRTVARAKRVPEA